ncbi:MAG: FRG domain-containing protein [Candidatus Aenigmarchaeota archaeon]|nr:FRG domain-containing protein [Candidatus Aenigmarchaeota archaeon]
MKEFRVSSEIELFDIIDHKRKEWVLFRGQENSKWTVDSKIVRSSIEEFYNIDYIQLDPSIRTSVLFHKNMIQVMQHKRNTYHISEKLHILAQENQGIDPEFEVLKLLQQYPDSESTHQKIIGTNLIDWSYDPWIALYFATNNTKNFENNDAVLYIYNSQNTPNVLQSKKLENVYSLMNDLDYQNCTKGMLPIIFHPQKLISDQRAHNQKAIYVAQMDFRYDLVDVWKRYEEETGQHIITKILIPENVRHVCRNHLLKLGYNQSYIYPN